MREGNDPLEALTRAIRGMLRYRNTASLQALAMMVLGLDEAAALIEADICTLGAMVIVDPEFEATWRVRMAERRRVLADLRQRAHLVRAATERAQAALEQVENLDGANGQS